MTLAQQAAWAEVFAIEITDDPEKISTNLFN